MRQPVGYLQEWPKIWTRDDREQIQQVARSPDFVYDALINDHSATLPRCHPLPKE